MADPVLTTAPVPAPPQVPMVYGNGFQVGMSNADVALILSLDNVPQARIAISFTTAKSLRDALTKGLAQFENITGHTIMTSDEIAERIGNMSGN